MRRLLLAALVAPILAGAACASFKDKRTPSGEFCSDMQVVPAGQEADSEYHRLQPISSDPKARTEAERLESLRKAACAVGGDAVIEAVNEEVRAENATYATVSSGTAIIWLRRPAGSGSRPLSLPNKKPAASASGDPAVEPPAPEASAEPSAAPTAAPAAPTGSAKAGPAPTGSAKAGKPPVKPPVKPPAKK
jgi:hypothetical protein